MGERVYFLTLILSCFLVLACTCTEGRTLINKEDEKKTEGQLRISWRFGAGVGSSFTTNGDSNEVTIAEPNCLRKRECGNGEKHRKKDHHEGGIAKGRSYGVEDKKIGVRAIDAITKKDINHGKPTRGIGGNTRNGGSIGSEVNGGGATLPRGKITRGLGNGISGGDTGNNP